jgi:hypothetical protein
MMSPPLAIDTPDRDHLAPLVAHLDLRRIQVTAGDFGNVRQAQLLARTASDRHVAQLLERLELPATRTCTVSSGRLHAARALDGVLLRQLRQHLVHVQPQRARRFCEIST